MDLQVVHHTTLILLEVQQEVQLAQVQMEDQELEDQVVAVVLHKLMQELQMVV